MTHYDLLSRPFLFSVVRQRSVVSVDTTVRSWGAVLLLAPDENLHFGSRPGFYQPLLPSVW
jgi:hypothetical protein